MSNWDERADSLRREREADQARTHEAATKAEAEAQARSQAAYDKLADLAGWAIGRYQAAGIQPTPIYVWWQEEVRVSRRESRLQSRKARIGEAYKLHQIVSKPVRDDPDVTSVLMVTPSDQIMTADDSEFCCCPSSISASIPEVGSRYKFHRDETVIWSESRPTGNLLDYMHPVDLEWARSMVQRREGISYDYGDILFNQLCDSIVAFVDGESSL
jgi:hypothetical protein